MFNIEKIIDNLIISSIAKGVVGATAAPFQAVFTIGLPGAGKSFVKIHKYLKHKGFNNIDPDDLKKEHPDYDPEKPFTLHEWSVNEAQKQFEDALKTGQSVVIDGTGTNSTKMLRRIKQANKHGYRTTLLYVYVPFEIAIYRNRNRARFVPEEIVVGKAEQIDKSFNSLKHYVDAFKVVINSTKKELTIAKKDLEIYPPPQKTRPPREKDKDYGLGKTASANTKNNSTMCKSSILKKAGKTSRAWKYWVNDGGNIVSPREIDCLARDIAADIKNELISMGEEVSYFEVQRGGKSSRIIWFLPDDNNLLPIYVKLGDDIIYRAKSGGVKGEKIGKINTVAKNLIKLSDKLNRY